MLSMGVQAVLVVVLLGVATTMAQDSTAQGNSLAFVLIHILKSLSLT